MKKESIIRYAWRRQRGVLIFIATMFSLTGVLVAINPVAGVAIANLRGDELFAFSALTMLVAFTAVSTLLSMIVSSNKKIKKS